MQSTAPVATGQFSVAFLSNDQQFIGNLSQYIEAHARQLRVVAAVGSWYELVSTSAFPSKVVFVDQGLRENIPLANIIRVCRSTGANVILVGQDLPAAPLPAGVGFVRRSDTPSQVLVEVAKFLGVTPAQVSAATVTRATYVKPKLSAGEAQALKLYASGDSTARIADKMNVGFETAKTYLRRVRAKYAGVDRPASRKAELMQRAFEDGLV